MASDLPDMHRSPAAMARSLVTYIADPQRVQREVRAQWGTAPNLYDISEMRRRHLKPPQPVEPFRFNEGYWPQDARKAAERQSARFLEALAFEREMSRLLGEVA